MPGAGRKYADTVGGGTILGFCNVFINNKPAAQVGDSVTPHPPCCCGIGCGCQEHCFARLARCSPNVFASNKNVVRAGDSASCLHPLSPGSFNVFVN